MLCYVCRLQYNTIQYPFNRNGGTRTETHAFNIHGQAQTYIYARVSVTMCPTIRFRAIRINKYPCKAYELKSFCRQEMWFSLSVQSYVFCVSRYNYCVI